MPRDLHGDLFGHSAADHVPGGSASEVVEELPRKSRCRLSRRPALVEPPVLDLLAADMEVRRDPRCTAGSGYSRALQRRSMISRRSSSRGIACGSSFFESGRAPYPSSIPAALGRRSYCRGSVFGGRVPPGEGPSVGDYRSNSSIAAERRSSVMRVGEYRVTMPLRLTKAKVGVAEAPYRSMASVLIGTVTESGNS